MRQTTSAVQNFDETLNKVLHAGLELNLMHGNSSRDLKNLVYDLDGTLNVKLNPKTNAIDQRKQERQIAELKQSKTFTDLEKSLSTIRKHSGWADLVENTQISFSKVGNKRVYKAFTTVI